MITLKNISVVYGAGTENEVVALNVGELEVEPGSWCNIIGANGSGKTTLLKALSGGIDSFQGSLSIDGHNATAWGPRRLSFLVQILEQYPERNTVPSLTILENLSLYSKRPGSSSFSFIGNRNVDVISSLLKKFDMGLEKRLFTQVGLLSGGQKQAVALAAVLLRSPKVLLLDEFLASIDPATTPKLLMVVEEMARIKSLTVLMVSHDLAQVAATGDRLLILSKGRVVQDVATRQHKLSEAEIIDLYSDVWQKVERYR